MFSIIKNNLNQKISCKEQFNFITGFLERVYFWPNKSNPDNVNLIFYLKLTFFTIIMCMPEILDIYFIYHFRSSFNSSMAPDLLTILVLLCLICIGMLIQANLKEFTKMINQMSAAPEQAAYNNFTINYKNFTQIIQYVIINLLVVCSFFKQWDTDNCENRKVKNGSVRSCGLLISTYLPFDFDFFPLKQFILLYQTVSAFMMFMVQVHMSLLTLAYVDKTAGTIVYLIDLVEQFNSAIENAKEVKKFLGKIVKIHQVVVSENRSANKHARLMRMVRHLFTRLILATSIFDAVEVRLDGISYCKLYDKFWQMGSIEPMMIGLCWLTATAIMEVGGQIIINKGVEFEKALYDTEWYKMRNADDRKSFILLYLMAQQPLALYSGPFVQVSNATFLEILKSSYSVTATFIRMVK